MIAYVNLCSFLAIKFFFSNFNLNNLRRAYTPQLNNTTLHMLDEAAALDQQQQQQQMLMMCPPEYSFEAIWTEPCMVAGDSSFNEPASKFFHIVDLYNQAYVCYLMPGKCQLRCLRVDYNSELEAVCTAGSLSYVAARDAAFIESRNLMAVVDPLGCLYVYSGLTKLCKLQLHNIALQTGTLPAASLFSGELRPPTTATIGSSNVTGGGGGNQLLQSPIVTPVKPSWFFAEDTATASLGEFAKINNQQQQPSNLFKTPKQQGVVAAGNLAVGSSQK